MNWGESVAKEFDTIETERLLLRGITESDADLIVKWRSQEDVYRFLKTPKKITLDDHMKWFREIYINNIYRFDWMCIEKDSGSHIGVFGLIKEGDMAEVNYLLAPEAMHKGYASEAVKALIEYASHKMGSKIMIAEIHENNKPSIALAKRLGFEKHTCHKPFISFCKEL